MNIFLSDVAALRVGLPPAEITMKVVVGVESRHVGPPTGFGGSTWLRLLVNVQVRECDGGEN